MEEITMEWYNHWKLKQFNKSYFKNEAIYYLWGIPYRLIRRKGENYIITENENLIFSTSPHNSQKEDINILLSWFEDLLLNEINKMKDQIEEKVGQKANNYYVKKIYWDHQVSNKLGICYLKKRVIEIDRRHTAFRKEVLESTLTHEILHLKIPEHTKEFFSLLEKYCPYNWAAGLCLGFNNPDFRYYNYLVEKKEKEFEYDFKEYCNIYNIKKEIL